MPTAFDPGSVSAPGLFASGDDDTGFYSQSADTIQLGIGGEAAVWFAAGTTTFYSGESPSNSDYLFQIRNEVPTANLTSTALCSLLFQGRTAQGNNASYVQIEARGEDSDDASLEGRLRITLRNGPQTSDSLALIDAYVNRANIGVPFRYVSTVEASDLTSDKDLASVEKVAAQIASGVGAPFPLHVPLLGSIADGTYPLISKAKFPFKINDVTLKSGAGSATVALTRDGSPIAGLSAMSASTTASDSSATGTGSEEFAAGAALAVDVSSASSLANLTIDISAELTS